MQILPLQGLSNTTSGSSGQTTGRQSSLFAKLLAGYSAGSDSSATPQSSSLSSTATGTQAGTATGSTTGNPLEAAKSPDQGELMNLKLTKADIAALHDKLQACGFSEAEIADMEAGAATATGMTWGALMATVQKKVSTSQSQDKKEISTNDQAQLLGLFGQLGFTGEQSQQFVDSLAKGDTASVWSAVQDKVSGLGSDSSINVTGSELSALARGLNLSETAQNRLTNLLESASAENGQSSSNIQTAMGLVQNEISAQLLEQRQSMTEFRQTASGVLSQAWQKKSTKERSDIHEDDVARKAAQAVAMRAESKQEGGRSSSAASEQQKQESSLLADVPEAGHSPLASRNEERSTVSADADTTSDVAAMDKKHTEAGTAQRRDETSAGSRERVSGETPQDGEAEADRDWTAVFDENEEWISPDQSPEQTSVATTATSASEGKVAAVAGAQGPVVETSSEVLSAETGRKAVSVVGQAQTSIDLSQGNPVFLSQLQAAAHAIRVDMQQGGDAEGEDATASTATTEAGDTAATATQKAHKVHEISSDAKVSEIEPTEDETDHTDTEQDMLGEGDAQETETALRDADAATADSDASQEQAASRAQTTRVTATSSHGVATDAHKAGQGQAETEALSGKPSGRAGPGAASTEEISEAELAEQMAGEGKQTTGGKGQSAPAVMDGLGQQSTLSSATAKTATGQLASQTARQLENGLLQNMGQGTKQLTLTLTPEGLGDLNITLTVKGKDVQARIMADRPETAAMLQDHAAHIKQTLADQGLKVTQFDVRSAVGQDGQPSWQGSGQNEQFSEQRETMEHLRDSMRLAQRTGVGFDGADQADPYIPSTLASRSPGLDLFA